MLMNALEILSKPDFVVSRRNNLEFLYNRTFWASVCVVSFTFYLFIYIKSRLDSSYVMTVACRASASCSCLFA